MMQWIDIEAFRGLRSLKLDNLGRVNLLMGPNNSGKTSVLEAVSIVSMPNQRMGWRRAAGLRTSWPFPDLEGGKRDLQGLEWLFPHDETGFGPIRIETNSRSVSAHLTRMTGRPLVNWERFRISDHESEPEDQRPEELTDLLKQAIRRSVDIEQSGLRFDLTVSSATEGDSPLNHELEFWERGFSPADGPPEVNLSVLNGFSHRYESTLQRDVSGAIKAKQKESLLQLMSHIEPNIKDIHILADDERGHGLFVEYVGEGFIPLSTLGDGMRRALHFASSLMKARGGVLLIDEIEIAIHTSVIGAVFDWLVDACVEHDVQLFATTHSLEAVDAILAGRRESLSDIVAFRLDGGRLAKRHRGELLHRLRFGRGLEVRR